MAAVIFYRATAKRGDFAALCVWRTYHLVDQRYRVLGFSLCGKPMKGIDDRQLTVAAAVAEGQCPECVDKAKAFA